MISPRRKEKTEDGDVEHWIKLEIGGKRYYITWEGTWRKAVGLPLLGFAGYLVFTAIWRLVAFLVG